MKQPKYKPGDKVRCGGYKLVVQRWNEKTEEYHCCPPSQEWFCAEKDLKPLEGED